MSAPTRLIPVHEEEPERYEPLPGTCPLGPDQGPCISRSGVCGHFRDVVHVTGGALVLCEEADPGNARNHPPPRRADYVELLAEQAVLVSDRDPAPPPLHGSDEELPRHHSVVKAPGPSLVRRLVALGARVGDALWLLGYSRSEIESLRRELAQRRRARATRYVRRLPRMARVR